MTKKKMQLCNKLICSGNNGTGKKEKKIQFMLNTLSYHRVMCQLQTEKPIDEMEQHDEWQKPVNMLFSFLTSWLLQLIVCSLRFVSQAAEILIRVQSLQNEGSLD